MKKNLKSFAKKAVATVAMAAAVVAAVPGMAMAGTTPDKGCPQNKANGYHNYEYYCYGFSHLKKENHDFKKNGKMQTCTQTYSYHGSKEQCRLCGKDTYVRGVHCDDMYHSSCGADPTNLDICTGIGSKVTIITE